MSIHAGPLIALANWVVRLFKLIVKVLLKPVWSVTIGPILKRSNELYLTRITPKRWDRLADGVTYQLHLPSTLSNDPDAVCRLFVRNEGEPIDRLEISVVAEKGNLTYPDVVVDPDLGNGQVAFVRLRNIPPQHLWASNDGIHTSYDNYRVSALTLIRNGKAQYVDKDVIRWSPTYTDFLNGHWTRHWGDLYNTDAIAD